MYKDLSIRKKLLTLFVIIGILPMMLLGVLLFHQVEIIYLKSVLGGLMNFVDAKQQGVIRLLDQNRKLASQLSEYAPGQSREDLDRLFESIVEKDVFILDDHPFAHEIQAGTRRIPTSKVYHRIDYRVDGVITSSSSPNMRGKTWIEPQGVRLDASWGYSDPYFDGDDFVLTFKKQHQKGAVYVHVDARMLSNIVNGEIGNLPSGIGAFYLAGVGKTMDYYITNRENVFITDSRVFPNGLLRQKGSEFPWNRTLSGHKDPNCKDRVYTTEAGVSTGCREAMGHYSGVGGNLILGASMPFYDSEWTIVVEQDAQEIMGPFLFVQNLIIGLSLFIALLVVIAGAIFAKSITLPLSKLATDMGKISDVDMLSTITFQSGALEEKLSALESDSSTTNNELDQLVGAFGEMATALSKSVVSKNFVENVFGTMADGLLVLDKEGRIQKSNRAIESLLDATEEDLFQRPFESLLSDPNIPILIFKDIFSVGYVHGLETTFQVPDDRKEANIEVALSCDLMKDTTGHHTGIVVLVQDIRQRKAAEERMYFLLNFDMLTRLPNRTLFLERLGQSLTRAPWRQRNIAILYCNVNRFKVVNDSLGFSTGNRLLQEIAKRLLSSTREGDTVSRIGGDEFVVLLNDLSATEDLTPIVNKIIDYVSLPIQLDGKREITVTLSIGASIYPTHCKVPDVLLKRANKAMYEARKTGDGTLFVYSDNASEEDASILALENSLRKAIPQGELRVYFQPRFSVNGLCLVGAEALVRWERPGYGLVPPFKFLPLAEEIGLMPLIDQWVFAEACRQTRQWKDAGNPHIRISVNVSHKTFFNKDFVEVIQKTLDEHRLSPDGLELELTENIVMENMTHALMTLKKLREMWVRLAIDDFGTGYSSFSYLKNLPVQVLKIDRSFLQDIENNQDNVAIVQAIISMAHTLGLEVTAEGVENKQHVQILEQSGCDELQGFFLGKPVPATEFENFF